MFRVLEIKRWQKSFTRPEKSKSERERKIFLVCISYIKGIVDTHIYEYKFSLRAMAKL